MRGRPPIVKRGKSLQFTNLDSLPGTSLRDARYHTITACKAPCNGTTGIAYPVANAKIQFDSAELGYGPPLIGPAKQTATWNLNVSATAGYTPGEIVTYYCRIHPGMRGAFEVSQ